MLSNLVKNGETISVLLTLKYNGFELKYNQSPTTPPPPGGVWVKGLYPYHRKSVVLKLQTVVLKEQKDFRKFYNTTAVR